MHMNQPVIKMLRRSNFRLAFVDDTFERHSLLINSNLNSSSRVDNKYIEHHHCTEVN